MFKRFKIFTGHGAPSTATGYKIILTEIINPPLVGREAPYYINAL